MTAPRSFSLLLLCLFSGAVSCADPQASALDIRTAPGDQRIGYETQEYETDSLSLELRKGKAADLLKIAITPQLGLPALELEQSNKPDNLKIQLGRKLFFDRRLSLNRTMSCAMCHIPEQGFTNNELSRPIGFEGRSVKRNAPSVLNSAFSKLLFADARETRLEQQAWSPLLASNEMNNPSIGFVINTIRSSPDYEQRFEQAFGQGPNMLNIGLALAQYQRSLVSGNSRFDRWQYAKQKEALNKAEVAGFELFMGKGRCASCHVVGEKNSLFTDNQLHNTGIGFRDSMIKPANQISVQLAPGMSTELERKIINSVGQAKPNDLGRYEITLDPKDRWKYRTPSLRNVALTAPYMHNGEFQTLHDVIEFYNRGGEPHDLLSPLIQPLNLSDDEITTMVAFLNSLTGSNIKTLVADAFAAPIGDE